MSDVQSKGLLRLPSRVLMASAALGLATTGLVIPVFVFMALFLAPAFSQEVAEATAATPSDVVPQLTLKNPLHFDSGELGEGPVLLGGQPSPEDLRALRSVGFHTVVNLRSEQEVAGLGWNEPALASELGFRYVAIPMAGGSGLTPENATKLESVLADAENYPVVVHCASGNRVGGLLALRGFFAGALDQKAAVALGVKAGLTSLEPAVAEILRQAADSERP